MSTKTDTNTSTTRHFWRGSNIVAGGGRHRRLTASGSSVLTRTLLDEPEVARADAALHSYGGCVDELVAVAKEPSEVTPSAIAQRFAEGERVDPIEFRELAEQAHRQAQLVTIERGGVREVGATLWAARDEAIDAALPAVIAAVSRSFAGLVDRLRSAGVEQDDADPGEAVRRDRVDEHRLLTAAVATYRDIRLAVVAVLGDAGIEPDPEGSAPYWCASLLEDALALDPWWPLRERGYVARNNSTDEVVDARTRIIARLDGTEHDLAWLAANRDAQVHVATPGQYRQVRKRMAQATTAAISACQNPDRVLAREGDGWRALNVADPRATKDVWVVRQPASAFE